MAGDEISEAGRQARFAQWEKLGLDAVKQDLATGGHRLIGGPPQVRALAREWVRFKEESAQVERPSTQENAVALLKALARATDGSAAPVVLEQLRDLEMTPDEARAAFHYLKGKGLIEAHFSIFYAARLSAAGHDAVTAAANTPPPEPAATAPKGSPELLTLKPGLWGVSIDLKEAGRRLRQRFTKS